MNHFPKPTESSRPTERPHESDREKNDDFYIVFAPLDSYLNLSSIEDGIDHLLCSVFFDPAVPCNLVGAQWLRIKRAYAPLVDCPQKLARVVAAQNSKLRIVWLAGLWSGI